MKIVNILGGLGNQLFQYAFAIALKEEFPEEEIKVNTSCFRGYPLHNGFEIENIFPGLNIPHASTKDLFNVAWPWTHYRLWQIGSRFLPQRSSMAIDTKYKEDFSFEMIKKKSYFDGYWQSPKFFEKYRKAIKKEFRFPTIDEDDKKNLDCIKFIENNKTAFIHVRRGDYINHPKFGNICTLEYYNQALEILNGKYEYQQYLVFSNDIDWCKENLGLNKVGKEIVYVDWNLKSNSFRDMQLMSLCNAGIIANSSFSWWGAWLGNLETVVCPAKWTNIKNHRDDIMPNNWIKIPS